MIYEVRKLGETSDGIEVIDASSHKGAVEKWGRRYHEREESYGRDPRIVYAAVRGGGPWETWTYHEQGVAERGLHEQQTQSRRAEVKKDANG